MSNKFDIQFELYMLLLTSEQMTANELAEILEVSRRTVFRYLDLLECSGVPIVRIAGQQGGVSILSTHKSYVLKRIHATGGGKSSN